MVCEGPFDDDPNDYRPGVTLAADAEHMSVELKESKVESQHMNVDVEDIKVKREDIKVEWEDVKVERNDVKIEGDDMKVEADDVKVERNDVKVEMVKVEMDDVEIKVKVELRVEWDEVEAKAKAEESKMEWEEPTVKQEEWKVERHDGNAGADIEWEPQEPSQHRPRLTASQRTFYASTLDRLPSTSWYPGQRIEGCGGDMRTLGGRMTYRIRR
jgi:hypothetical protein